MRFHRLDLSTEQGALRLSILCTACMAVSGIIFGLIAGSFAIIFDGIYELTDAGMTLLALLVANMIRASTSGEPINSRLAERFTMGFWHLEPIVLVLNGALLIGAAIYALIHAIDSIMTGGRQVHFDYAVIFSLLSLIGGLIVAYVIIRSNRTIRSEFLSIDAKSWLIGGAFNMAWLLAFSFGLLIEGTSWDWITPYIDPVVLALVCLIVIPIPIGTVRQAVADILLVTPYALKEQVDATAQRMVERYGFLFHRSYVAKVGRGRQIELNFIVPTNWPAKRLEEWDAIRDAIGREIGDDDPDMWLTIIFTTDPEWAD